MKLHLIKNYLEIAINYFESKNYNFSMKFFSLILSLDKSNINAQIGVLLSDYAMEDEETSIEYFNRFVQFIHDDEIKIEILNELVFLEETKNELIEKLFTDSFMEVKINSGIEYNDFKKMLENCNDKHELIANFMFSTKLIISSRIEMLDFIELLYENNFKDEALSYLESAIDIYPVKIFLKDILKDNQISSRDSHENKY